MSCASDRLAISSLLSCIFSGALICSFIWAIFLILVSLLCKGVEPLVFTRASNAGLCVLRLYVGEGSDREQWCLLHSLLVFSRFPRYPQANWALLVLILGWVVCVCSRILWVSPTNTPERLGVSPAAASTLTGVFNQRFEALLPCAGALGCEVCFAPPPFLPVYLCAPMWGCGVC